MKPDDELKHYYSAKLLKALKPTHSWVFIPKFKHFPKLCKFLGWGKYEIVFLNWGANNE